MGVLSNILTAPESRARWLASAVSLRFKMSMLRLTLERHFNPLQPRAPAGRPDGGQWIDDASGSFEITLAGGRGRGTYGAYSAFPDATPAQQARLAITTAQAEAIVARVHRIDPTWRKPTGLNVSIEGAIAQNEQVIRAAETRLLEKLTELVGPGPSQKAASLVGDRTLDRQSPSAYR